MTRAMHRRSKALFLEALELEPEARDAFLDDACSADRALRLEVARLLEAHAESAPLEDWIAATPEAPVVADEPERRVLGDYELLEVLGRGASGTVYRARQRALGRRVALKVLRAGSFAGEDELRRFRREAEAAAALDHPGIVPVFEIGELEQHHYFSMKCIEGRSLDRDLERLRHDPRGAVRLVATVARAVHHAHRRGVLHRDLKPSNILLDRDGTPYVADFGIARTLGGERITQTGIVSGTPAYMSPEQARGDADVTVATDVWSLGCVLHELVTGAVPFRGEGMAEILQRVQFQGFARPRNLDRDLATILETCLRKEPTGRYRTAEALAEDLERWLDHLPIAARPATRLERLRLLRRRSPVAFHLGLTVALLLVILGVGAGVANVALRERLEEARVSLRASLLANARAERRSDAAGRRLAGLERLARAATLAGGSDLRDEAIALLSAPDLVPRTTWRLDGEPVSPLAVDPGLQRVVFHAPPGTVTVRSAGTGELEATLSTGDPPVRGAALTHDGRRLWLLRRPQDGEPARLEAFDLADGEAVRVYETALHATHFVGGSAPQGLGLLHRERGTVVRLDAASGGELATHALQGPIAHAALDPEGERLAVVAREPHRVEVLDSNGERHTTIPLPAAGTLCSWSRDGTRLVVACQNQCAYVHDASAGELVVELRGHEAEVVVAELLPGPFAVTRAWDGTTRLWDLAGEELLRSEERLVAFDRSGRRAFLWSEERYGLHELLAGDVLRVQRAHVGKAPREVATSADGEHLFTCGDRGWIRWDAGDGTRLETRAAEGLHSIFHDAHRRIVTSGAEGLLRHGAAGEPPEVLLEGPCKWAGRSADGRWIGVVRGEHGHLLGPEGTRLVVGPHAGLDRVALSPDGAWLAIGSWLGAGVRLWATPGGELAAHLVPEVASAIPSFSPDGRYLALTTLNAVELLSVGSWESVRRFGREDPRSPIVPAAFSHDGQRMAFGATPGLARLVSVADGRVLANLEPARPHVLFHLAFARDGRRLAAASPGRRLLIWNLDALRSELLARGLLPAEDAAWFEPPEAER